MTHRLREQRHYGTFVVGKVEDHIGITVAKGELEALKLSTQALSDLSHCVTPADPARTRTVRTSQRALLTSAWVGSTISPSMHGPVTELDFAQVLREELAGLEGQFANDELAFLALTSKVELPVRDRLAYALFRRLPPCLLVAREWRRIDLAVLSRGPRPTPRMLLEAKALYTFDLVGDDRWVIRYPEKVERDLLKLREIDGIPGAAHLFGLILATHPTNPIDGELAQVAKYSRGIAKAVREMRDPDAVEKEARRNLRSRLGKLGPIHEGKLRAGTAYGVQLEVLYWLLGPIDHSDR